MYDVEYSEDCAHHGRENGHHLERGAELSARLHNALIHGSADHDCARVVESDIGASQREVLGA